MRLSIEEHINIFENMLKKGVVIYGAGNQGMAAIEKFEAMGIHIVAIADRQVGKKCGKFCSVSLETLCERANNEVCVITPNLPLQDVWEKLRHNYSIVIDILSVFEIFNVREYCFPHLCSEMDYTLCHPFNCYDSPYIQDIELEVYRRITPKDELKDIDLSIDFQKGLLPKVLHNSNNFLKKQAQTKNFRYKSNNGWFDDGDAGLLHSMILEYKPKRIIEIGSGYSTCVMLDTNEYWFDNHIDIICIEPYPQRLMENIRNNEKLEIRKEFVQNVPLEIFDTLESNDILFIDSSHVVKVGGDIVWEYFHIIPRLKNGVIIHIHDIAFPFTYSEKWILQGRAYTEAFLLRAFLMNNNSYKILFFNNMMIKKYYEEYVKGWNNGHELSGFGSIWIQKCEMIS